VLVQVLDREEIAPRGEGPLKLTDMETGQSLAVTMDAPILVAYRERISEYFGALEAFALRNGIEYLRTSTLVPFEDVVLKYLRQGAHLHLR
jgi:hypothetical protein